jgi:ABC-type Mn2+/Zn2+ transport system permease subunit
VRVSLGSYIFTAMYLPLIGGFVAFVLFAILMGWIMDPSRHGGDANHDGH